MKPETKAAALFDIGAEKARAFDRDMKLLRRNGIDAAFAFMQARELVPHGDWTLFCEVRAEKISPRQVRFWIQLAEESIAWVREQHPEIKTISDLQAAARELVMQSPKPLIALCRELGHMRKFGEYDAIKYAQKRLGGGSTQQIEFEFAKVLPSLDLLAQFGEGKIHFIYPEGADTVEFMTEVETKLEAALKRVREVKQHGRHIES